MSTCLLPPPPIRGGAQLSSHGSCPQNPHPVDRRSAGLPWPGSQLQAEATGCGACLTRSPGSALGFRRSILPGQTLGSRWKEAGGVTQEGCLYQGKEPKPWALLSTKASPERSQRLDWYLLLLATPTVHLVCCVGAGEGGGDRGWGGGGGGEGVGWGQLVGS